MRSWALLLCLVMCSCATPSKGTGKTKHAKPTDSDSGNALGLTSIHFPPDSLILEPGERDLLVKDAEILAAHPGIHVELEGHTDGRGEAMRSFELAQSRAEVIKRVLIGLGIEANRLTTISYGKDKLLDRSETEVGYARNRRVNFLVISY